MRTFLKLPIALILIFITAIALTFYLATQTTLPHSIVERLLTNYVESRYNVHVSFGDIEGSLWRDMHVDNVTVDFDLAPNRYRLIKIKRVSVYYDLANLISKKWQLDSLIVVEPVVVLRSSDSGVMLLPKFGGAGGTARKPLNFGVDKFRLVDGKFQLFRLPSAYFVDSIEMVAASSYEDGLLTVRLDSLSLIYPQRDFRIEKLRAQGALSENTVGIDTLELKTGNTTLIGGGLYSLASDHPFSFRFADSHVSLDEVARVAGINISGQTDFDAELIGNSEKFEGRAKLNGVLFDRHLGPLTTDYAYSDGILSFSNLSGSAFDGSLAGKLELDLYARPESYTADLRVRGLNLDKIVPNTFHSSINGRLQFAGAGLRENSFSLDMQAACSRGSFDFVNFDSLSGTISLNVNDMYFHPDFTLLYKHSRFEAEGPVNYTGDMNLEGTFRTSQLADFWGDLFIEELSGGARATYTVSGPNLDPNIKGEFDGDSCSFYGFSTDSLKADFDIESFLYRQRGSVNLHAFASDVWNLPADSVFATVEIDSADLSIPTAELIGNRYRMAASAQAVLHDSTASVTIQDYRFDFDSLQYQSTAPFGVEFLADGISVADMKIAGEGGSAAIRCDYGYDSTISLSVSLDTLPIAPWLSVLQIDTLLAGRLNAQGEMRGKLKNPQMTLDGNVNSLTYGDAPVGTVAGSLSLTDSMLTVNEVSLDYEQSHTVLSGQVPLIMDLDSGLVMFPDEALDLQLNSSGDNMNLVSLSLEDLESLVGDYQLQLEIYGTLQHPQSKGTFSMKNGTAKIYEMENPIENIEATMHSQGRKIYVDWVQGTASYKGKSGKLVATGEINILSRELLDYDLEVRGTNVPIKYDLGDIYARCDIDVLEITGSNPPVARGNVIVYEAEYLDEFEEESLVAAKEAADTVSAMDYVINVDFLPGSVRVRNSDVNMVLDGQLTVIRENAKDNYIGTLNVVRGNFYLFDLTFDIEEGSQIIFDDIENPNPTLNINVYTDIRSYAEGTGVGYNRLYLVIGGTLLQPSITAAEGSGYTEEDILSLLLWSSPASASAAGGFGSTPLEQRVYDYLGRNISQKLTRSLGVERLEIIPSYGQNSEISGAEISLGFYTTPNLYTYFTSPLAFGRSAELGFEYRIGRNFYVRGNRDAENLYHLNLNLNWDFK
jgi:autotransporter translocation and assembly factor TamB